MNHAIQPTTSIAVCTFNGADYLSTQWASLLAQEQLPDEVVVCDDQSTDGTVALLHRLAAQSPFPVRILKNPVRLGYNKNFEKALLECTSDLIFICDQDDAWFPDKIKTMARFMVDHPDIEAAFCDAWVTDEQLQERQSRFWEWVRFDTATRSRWQSGEMMEVMLDGNRVMGCATVLRSSFLANALPVPESVPGYIYDGWLGLVGAARHSVAFIDEPLQLYRTHPQQQIGVRESDEVVDRVRLLDRFGRQREKKLAPLREKQSQLAVINKLLRNRLNNNAPGLAALRRRLSHFTMRSCLPHERHRRIGPVLASLREGNYQRYADASANWYAPYLAALGDILE